MNSWDDLKGNLSGWFDAAAHRTDRLTRLGVRAYDRYGIHRDLDRHFARLGALVHRMLAEDSEAKPGQDAAVRAEMGKIARLQDELSQTQSEMNELRQDMKSRPDADASPSEAPEAPESPDGAPESQGNHESEPPVDDGDAAKSG